MDFILENEKKVFINFEEGRWYFPGGKDLEKTSASNAYVETFKDNKIESLAREICQNSLDATDGSGKLILI
ncbi:hypothetical protein ACXM1Q_008875 [Streptococcus sp. 10F2]